MTDSGERRAAPRRGRWERFVFSFMGPPQLGDPSAPAAEPTPVQGPPCTKCGRSYDDHEIVRDPRLTYVRCPSQ